MMLRIIILFTLLFCDAYAQVGDVEENYSNEISKDLIENQQSFSDIYGNAINDYSKDAPSLFSPIKPTPSRFFSADLSIPEIFSTSNNLAKKPGSFYRAFGEVIFIQGVVSDSFGVPIEGAVIEIWQKNAAGKYHTLLEDGSEYIDKYFNMSGRAITDNLGHYQFITILPGSTPGRAPHINMNVYHQKFGRLETEMYFQDHPYNKSDYQYLAYDEEERKMLTAKVWHSKVVDPKSIKLCTFNITMKGVHKFKKF